MSKASDYFSANKAAALDPRVKAVRADRLVGKGSCTTVDEALTDAELLGYLEEDGAETELQAVNWARDYEGLVREQALNSRWGEDDDPQLKEHNEWKRLRNEAEVIEKKRRRS